MNTEVITQGDIDRFQFITTKQAAEISGVSDRYIRMLCRDNRLPSAKSDNVYLVPRISVVLHFNVKMAGDDE